MNPFSRKAAVAAAAFASLVTLAACSSTSNHKASSSTSNGAGPTNSGGSGGSSSAAQGRGVTPSTIRVGITYPDLSQLSKTLNLNGGNYPEAFTALINQVNAQGGVNGRKLVPYIAPVNVVGTAPAQAACTRLTEDDQVFVTIGFFQAPDTQCYLKTHDTPLIGASLTADEEVPGEAPWFNSIPSNDHLVPQELKAFQDKGVFTGHKVAVVGETADVQEMNDVVIPGLKSLGIPIVSTATSTYPSGDDAARNQEYELIDQRFKAAGADVVVAVGDAGSNWAASAAANHDTYLPREVATNENTLAGYTLAKGGYDPAVVKNAISAIGIPPASIWWNDPTMQSCIATIKKAYPTDQINDPVGAPAGTPETWSAPQTACQEVPLLVDILKAAGPTINNTTFNTGGKSLNNITLPGSGGALHFGPGHHDGNGPVFIYVWNDSTNSFDVSAAS